MCELYSWAKPDSRSGLAPRPSTQALTPRVDGGLWVSRVAV